MGSGYWSRDSFATYSIRKGRKVDAKGNLAGDYQNQELFQAKELDTMLNPMNVMRECCETREHPNTVPVILALDVTGSMGQAAVEVAKKLNDIMTMLYQRVQDVEFMIMGIGDFAYDGNPLQVSQFESDIRIAEQLDKLYFEFGGGGNYYESYTAAWYFALHHTKLDCWKRGQKGIIITLGDERINPYIPLTGRRCSMESVIGDKLQGDVETKDLYQDVKEKYEIYHLNVNHRNNYDKDEIERSFREYLDEDHFKTVQMDSISNLIIHIVEKEANRRKEANNKMAG